MKKLIIVFLISFCLIGCGKKEEVTENNYISQEANIIYNAIVSIQDKFNNPQSIIVKNVYICNIFNDVDKSKIEYSFSKVDLSAQNKMGGYTNETFYINLDTMTIGKTDTKYKSLYNYKYCEQNKYSLTGQEIKSMTEALQENY